MSPLSWCPLKPFWRPLRLSIEACASNIIKSGKVEGAASEFGTNFPNPNRISQNLPNLRTEPEFKLRSVPRYGGPPNYVLPLEMCCWAAYKEFSVTLFNQLPSRLRYSHLLQNNPSTKPLEFLVRRTKTLNQFKLIVFEQVSEVDWNRII